MFWNRNKKKEAEAGIVYASQSGSLIPIGEMPDPVFAEKVLGDGVCIIPSDGRVLAPIGGVVSTVADAGHAYGIKGEDGVNILVHIGIDTVEMEGAPFAPAVQVGDRVRKGDPLCSADLAAIEKAGFLPHTAIILVDSPGFAITRVYGGRVEAGESPAFCYGFEG